MNPSGLFRTSFRPRAYASGFLGSVAVLSGGTVIAQVLPMALTPLITRLYSPSDMGLLALFVAFIGIATPLGSLQYSKAIVSAGTDDEAAKVGMLSLLIIIPISILFAALAAALIRFSLAGFGELPYWTVPAVFASLTLTAIFSVFRYWQVRSGGYKAISGATIWQSVGRVSTQLAGGILTSGSAGLVLGEVIGRGLGLRELIYRSTMLNAYVRKRIDWSGLVVIALKYKKFPLLSAPSMFLNSMALSLPAPLISSGYGLAEAGQFSIAARVMLIPLVIVGTSVGDVFHNRLAALARDEPERARGFFVRVSISLLAAGVLPLIVVIFFGPRLWTLVLGAEWELSGRIAQAMAPWALAQLVVSPVSQVIPVYQRQELKLVYDCLGLASVAIVLVCGPKLGFSLLSTVTILGISQAIIYAVYFVLLSKAIPSSQGPYR